jgi:sugar-specific transcriptional regulator TrmB
MARSSSTDAARTSGVHISMNNVYDRLRDLEQQGVVHETEIAALKAANEELKQRLRSAEEHLRSAERERMVMRIFVALLTLAATLMPLIIV